MANQNWNNELPYAEWSYGGSNFGICCCRSYVCKWSELHLSKNIMKMTLTAAPATILWSRRQWTGEKHSKFYFNISTVFTFILNGLIHSMHKILKSYLWVGIYANFVDPFFLYLITWLVIRIWNCCEKQLIQLLPGLSKTTMTISKMMWWPAYDCCWIGRRGVI